MRINRNRVNAQRYDVYRFALSGLVDSEKEARLREKALTKSIARHKKKIRKISLANARKARIVAEKKVIDKMKSEGFKDSVKNLFIFSAKRFSRGGVSQERAKKDLTAFKKRYLENSNGQISSLAKKIVAEIRRELKEGKK